MRYIDLETWPRSQHFGFFKGWDYPHFGMCANVDLTAFLPYVKKQGISFNLATVYAVARAANAIAEFRYRIRGEDVVEHEVVHPGTMILTAGDLFAFCILEYSDDFAGFAARGEDQIRHVKEHPVVENDPARDDMVYMSAIPWVSFTSVMHPLDLSPVDSIPRFVWGKFFQEGELWKMPLSVQAHHALLDGLHLGRFYAKVQELLDQPEVVLGGR